MKIKGVKEQWERYKYVALAALAGVCLLAWPKSTPAPQQPQTLSQRDMEAEMEDILGRIQGVGQVKVLLTAESDGAQILAQDTEERLGEAEHTLRTDTVVLEGEGGDEPLVLRRDYPTYRGALVVCSGGDNPAVKLTVIQAVASLTGLGRDRITVAKWQ